MFWYGHGMSGWGWCAMSVGMLLFWTALIIGAVLLTRALIRSGKWDRLSMRPPAEPPADHGPARPSPEQVLADRFARGEIDEQEFRARLGALHETDRLAKH
nr:SHOCT domain-containing protein [Frankia nepalensis]